MTPAFLHRQEIEAIHDDQLAHYGGVSGIRDAAMLESITARPAQTFGGGFLHRDLAAMAGAYLHGIVHGHLARSISARRRSAKCSAQ
jgi:death-on-curing protein